MLDCRLTEVSQLLTELVTVLLDLAAVDGSRS